MQAVLGEIRSDPGGFRMAFAQAPEAHGFGRAPRYY